jgi:hypothetical protein
VSDDRIPDIPESIIAYRNWTVTYEDVKETVPQLQSVSHKVVWPTDGPLRAECGRSMAVLNRPEGDVFPCPYEAVEMQGLPGLMGTTPRYTGRYHVMGYGCGIYAFAEPNDFGHMTMMPNRVAGVVALGGKVWMHDTGYRAEYALPIALYRRPESLGVMRPFPEVVELLAERYSVDLLDMPETLEEWFKTHRYAYMGMMGIPLPAGDDDDDDSDEDDDKGEDG